jgi:uncharacterized protein YnzC (UPF0291/DUF896 family)
MSDILSTKLTKAEIKEFQNLYEKYLNISLTEKETVREALDFLTVISTLLFEGDFLDTLKDDVI